MALSLVPTFPALLSSGPDPGPAASPGYHHHQETLRNPGQRRWKGGSSFSVAPIVRVSLESLSPHQCQDSVKSFSSFVPPSQLHVADTVKSISWVRKLRPTESCSMPEVAPLINTQADLKSRPV